MDPVMHDKHRADDADEAAICEYLDRRDRLRAARRDYMRGWRERPRYPACAGTMPRRACGLTYTGLRVWGGL